MNDFKKLILESKKYSDTLLLFFSYMTLLVWCLYRKVDSTFCEMFKVGLKLICKIRSLYQPYKNEKKYSDEVMRWILKISEIYLNLTIDGSVNLSK